MSGPKLLVVGGGIAGQTAALRCRDAGCDVTLLEARPRLGGATTSFRRGDLVVDTGQHVVLRCYAAYAALLRRIGAQASFELPRGFHVPMVEPGGRSWTLRGRRLPAPAHLAPALLGHRALSPAQRLAAARTALALRALDPEDPELDRSSFGEWLSARREPDRNVHALWGLLTVAALNAEPDDASLALAARVFRTGVLDTASGGDIGIPRQPLGQIHDVAAREALDQAGVAVRTRTKALELRRRGTGLRVSARGEGGTGEWDADSVVVAVPHAAASKLLDELEIPEAREWSRLSAAPIVNAHVIYDRPVTDRRLVAAIDSPVQWVFDRTAVSGLPGGQYLALSLSAARSYIDTRTQDLADLFLPALRDVFPAARAARVLDFFVTREPRATFLQAPGTRALRPPAETRVPGVVLAGAWTDTGWPDTIEGAVTSGDRAAEAVVRTSAEPAARGVEVRA